MLITGTSVTGDVTFRVLGEFCVDKLPLPVDQRPVVRRSIHMSLVLLGEDGEMSEHHQTGGSDHSTGMHGHHCTQCKATGQQCDDMMLCVHLRWVGPWRGPAGHRIRPCYLVEWGGGLQYWGEGEVFALKRQRLRHFVGHWITRMRRGIKISLMLKERWTNSETLNIQIPEVVVLKLKHLDSTTSGCVYTAAQLVPCFIYWCCNKATIFPLPFI